MKKTNVKLAITVIFALAASLLLPSILSVPKAANQSIKQGMLCYSILSEKNKTVQVDGPASKSWASIIIPETVKIGGTEYNVVQTADGAFAGMPKLGRAIIGENVTRLGKKSFYNCRNLKIVIVKAQGLTKASVGSSAFAKINAKAAATVPQKKLSSYKKIFKSRGLNGKKQKVKAGKGEKEQTFGPDRPLPDPDSISFTIGNWSDENAAYTSKHAIRDSMEYSADEEVPFTAGIRLHPDIYGAWNTREKTRAFVRCGVCSEWFGDECMFALHEVLSECGGGNGLIGETNDIYPESYFVPDQAPCRVVYRFTLPQGLSYKAGSLKVVNMGVGEIDKSKYSVDISGNEIAVTIADIKAFPFYTAFDLQKYNEDPDNYVVRESGEVRSPINVTFGTVMNENTALDNTASASITYSYKGAEKTIGLGDAVVHAASLKISNTDKEGNSLDGALFDLYQEKPAFKEGSATGTVKWEKIAEGLKAGEIFKGIGMGWENRTNGYRVVQTAAPAGYEKASSYSFTVRIKSDGKTVVTAVDDFLDQALDVEEGVIQVHIRNRK